MRTYVPTPSEIDRQWWVVDAEGMPMGRLASEVASRLRGKHKPSFTPFLDTGDHVIVVNADKVVLTGKKLDSKVYYSHSGYPGGIKGVVARRMLSEKPERAVELAVKRMLPKNKLGRKMLTKLRVYRGGEHKHQAQKPQPLELGR
jgi:large subunit ribosomal protein L13